MKRKGAEKRKNRKNDFMRSQSEIWNQRGNKKQESRGYSKKRTAVFDDFLNSCYFLCNYLCVVCMFVLAVSAGGHDIDNRYGFF